MEHMMLDGNPAGNRAKHHPSICLQSSVGRRVSTACLINDTDHQYLDLVKTSKTSNPIPPPVLTHGENQLWNIGKERPSIKNKKCQSVKISKKVY